MTALLHRTSSDLASMSRAAQRKQRLLEIEKEQHLEDAEALKMTEEQRQILLRSFTSVKVEFSDLDGLKWTHSALRKRMHGRHASHPNLRVPSSSAPSSPPPDQHTFVILTNADLASHNAEDTIRASRSRPRLSFSHPHKPPQPKSWCTHRPSITHLSFHAEPPDSESDSDSDDFAVEDDQGHAKRQRRLVPEPCPPPEPTPSPTPTQQSFTHKPSPSSSFVVVPPLRSLRTSSSIYELPSPTAPTIPISQTRRVPSNSTPIVPSNASPARSSSFSSWGTAAFPPGLGGHRRAWSVVSIPSATPVQAQAQAQAQVQTRARARARTQEAMPVEAHVQQPRAVLSLDCSALPPSTSIAIPREPRSTAGDTENEEGDADVFPPTPRPRDFVREEL